MAWTEYSKQIKLSNYDKEFMDECEVEVYFCYREGVNLVVSMPYEVEEDGIIGDVYGTNTKLTKEEALELIKAIQEAVLLL